MGELILRFLFVGALAFGGGQAALPLVERLTVADTGWLSAREFTVGVGLAYATPGPVLILATFVGYRVGGVLGALLATFAVFAVPVFLTVVTARLVVNFRTSVRFQTFGRYACAAAIGLLGVTLISLVRPLLAVHPVLVLPAGAVFIAAWRGVSPLVLLAVGVMIGAAVGYGFRTECDNNKEYETRWLASNEILTTPTRLTCENS